MNVPMITSALIALSGCAGVSAVAEMPDDPTGDAGLLYRSNCAACHGEGGAGDGPAAAYLAVRPRDFRRQEFRFTTSLDGTVASARDIERFVRRGSPTSHMPGHPSFTDDQIRLVSAYVREFRRLGVMADIERAFLEEDEEVSREELLEITADRMEPGNSVHVPLRRSTGSDPARGAALFLEHCASCHGAGGRGDGTEDLEDDLGYVMSARDLTRGEYRGGSSDRDLFTRIRCGLPGTPMPALGPQAVSDADVWLLVDHLRALAGSSPRKEQR